jgi:hypothetical protein
MKPKLDRWIQHENCVVGYIYDSPQFPSGTRIMTDAIRFIDVLNFEAECLDGKYKLGEPGTHREHTVKIIGKPESELLIKESHFLNPNG